MKTPADLREVRLRLEKSAAMLPGEPDSPQDLYDRYEEMAFAILDSEHADWPSGLLEEYLTLLLKLLALERCTDDGGAPSRRLAT
jgi:hypothetical protein